MDIISLAIRQVEREGKLARKDWMVLVLDRMVVIRDQIIKNRSQTERINRRWKK